MRLSVLTFWLLTTCLWAAAQAPTQGLQAYYTFNNTPTDAGPNANHGAMYGGIEPATDRYGSPCGALHFNGKDGHLEIPHSPSLAQMQGAYTIAVWFRPDKNPDGYMDAPLLTKGDGNAQFRARLLQHFKTGLSEVSAGAAYTGPDKAYEDHLLLAEKWYFLALVCDDGWAYAYLNNQLIWQLHTKIGQTANTQPLKIAYDPAAPGAKFFAGCIDDLRLYNRALSPGEVTMLYNEPPVEKQEERFSLKLPRDITINTEKGQCYAVVNFARPQVDISCGTYELKQSTGFASGSAFPAGVNTIVFEATTPGKRLVDSFHIIVNDHDAPAMDCPTGITARTLPGDTLATVAYPEVKAIDNCANTTLKLVQGYKSGGLFPVGVTTVAYTATDAGGNHAECSFTVTVEKTERVQARPAPPDKAVAPPKPQPQQPKPTPTPATTKAPAPPAPEKIVPTAPLRITCAPNITKANDAGKCGAAVTYTPPTVSGGQRPKLLQTNGVAPGGFFPVGYTLNTFATTDMAGAMQECTFNILIQDKEAPAFTCPADTTIMLNPGRRGIIYNYQPPAASDNCGLDSVVMAEGAKSGCFLPVGTHPFAFAAYDASGNKQTCAYTVTVVSNPDPGSGKAPTFIDENLNIGNDEIKYEHKVESKNCLLTVFMFDDGEEDNDTVSIIFNDQLIVDKEMIRIKENGAIKRFIPLLSGTENYIAAKAWNTGQYGLNTLKIEVYEGYIENEKKDLKGRKPLLSKVLHSRPGQAGGVILKCKW